MKLALLLGTASVCALMAAGCAAIFPPAASPWLALLLIYWMAQK